MPKRKPKPQAGGYKPITDAEAAEFARQLYKGELFTSHHIRTGDESVVHMVFLALGFMTDQQRADMLGQKPFTLYAPMSSALPRGVNGYPILTELGWWDKADTERVQAKYKALKAAAEGI